MFNDIKASDEACGAVRMRKAYDEDYAIRLKRFHQRPHGQAIYDAVLSEIQGSLRAGRTKLLEFGCGNGTLLSKLGNHCWYCDQVGYDPNLTAFGTPLPAPNTSYTSVAPKDDFHIVLCSNVIGHVESYRSAMAYFRDCLKRWHGTLIVTIPSRSYWLAMSPANWMKGYKSDPTLKKMWGVRELVHELGFFGFKLLHKQSVSPQFCGLLHESHVLTFTLEY